MFVVVHVFVLVECGFVFQCAFCLWMYGLFDDVCVIVNVASNFGSVCSSLMSVHSQVCARVLAMMVQGRLRPMSSITMGRKIVTNKTLYFEFVPRLLFSVMAFLMRGL